MRSERKLLSPLASLSGMVMLGVTGATLLAIVQHLSKTRKDARGDND
jgi:hypothetical protein